jgi:periodic tryptophan protein 1|tara:strand:+ start:237 stop:1847 length:1611 start_codon:yes stop_codon:yes gene_type:complete|mmetsp:Transcript_7084/g.31995  ORF Transcript_7084/g.31995 Transcript_7084/m.31995 type:complete len:537 (+) Transcript_7084:136-1746(+)
MISAIAWIPLGVAAEVPKYALPEPGIAAEEGFGHNRLVLEDNESEEWEEVSSENTTEDEMADSAPVSYAWPLDVSAQPDVSKVPIDGDGLDMAMAELDMERYDDNDNDADVKTARLFGGESSMFHAHNDEDAYMTVKDDMDREVEDFPDDFTLRSTDLIILAARTDDDVSHLEMYVYEEPVLSGTDEGNLYCHHDLVLPAFPLCITWMNCPLSGQEESHSNSVAVGTMYPGIEIWDLNVIDALEPKATLGGYQHELMQDDAKQKKKIKKNPKHLRKNLTATRKSGKKSPIPVLRRDSHADAVLGLSWNAQHRNVLASASADRTVRIWDLSTESTQQTLSHHSGKVQAVEWNRFQPSVLLTGGFDGLVTLVDVRDSRKAAMVWNIGADVECALWKYSEPTQLIASSENGEVISFDSRKGKNSEPVFSFPAHEKATTCLSLSSGVPDLLVTSSMDKTLKLWDIAADEPSLVAQNNPGIGSIFTAAFSSSVPYLVGCAGSNGQVAIWDVLGENIIAEGPHGQILEKYNRAAALKSKPAE